MTRSREACRAALPGAAEGASAASTAPSPEREMHAAAAKGAVARTNSPGPATPHLAPPEFTNDGPVTHVGA